MLQQLKIILNSTMLSCYEVQLHTYVINPFNSQKIDDSDSYFFSHWPSLFSIRNIDPLPMVISCITKTMLDVHSLFDWEAC